MSRQVLGKRTHTSFSSSSPSRSPTPAPKSRHASAALELPSPSPTPNPKRVKTCVTETSEDDGSNKENIPPEPISEAPNASDALNSNADASASTATMTPRALRASRRASAISTRSTQARGRMSPSISQPETPSKSTSHLPLATPPSTPASMPPPRSRIAKHASATNTTSLHTLVRALLRPQANGSVPLVGRERERKQILDFLRPFLADESHSDDLTSLYVSGAPGTGKTALVNEVLASIASRDGETMDVDHASIRVLYMNCMTLGVKDGMTGVYERCLEQLGSEKTKKRGSITKVDWSEHFGNLFRGQKCILVLDEIDHLAASTSASISIAQIFALASDSKTRPCLRVIGISNTHTLTHAKPTTHSRIIHFQPYTSSQMKSILDKRLESLSASGFDASRMFPTSTIGLLAFKIANQTGDIRTVFSVARRALDLAAAGSHASSPIAVTPAHVLTALKASNTSQSKRDSTETVTIVRNLGLQSRFALAALLIATKRVAAGLSLTSSSSTTSSGLFKENANPAQGRDATVAAIEVTPLHGFYAAILGRGAHGAFHPVGRTEFGDLIGLLEGSGLVELTQGRGSGNKTKSPTKSKGTQVICVSRGVREEELVRALVGSTNCAAGDDAIVNVGEEEVKKVWEREVRRLEREVKAKFGDTAQSKVAFEGAEED